MPEWESDCFMSAFFRIRKQDSVQILLNERGILLVSVAMIFALATAFVAVAATRTVQDTRSTALRADNISSFYAAHAGEQAMLASIRRDAVARFAVAQGAWTGTGAVLTNPNSFFTNQEVTLPGVRLPDGSAFDTVRANIQFVNSQVSGTRQVFNFQYNITSQGTDPDNADRLTTVVSSGNFQIQVQRQSFANYALFTGTHTITNGTRVWFTSDTNFTGRVHTNERFAFAFYPTFSNGQVSSVDSRAYFYNNGSTQLLDADHNAPRDIPVFGEGFQRGAPGITLPANAFDQKASTVGGPASDNSELRESLGLPPGVTPPPDGTYVPNDGASLTGGIYVQGNVSDILVYVDAQDRQSYHIVHSNGTTSDITVDVANNETVIDSITYDGVPNGAIYVAGEVRSFGGPTRTFEGVAPPAIESTTAISLFAEGDVVITRDIVYEDDPQTVESATNVLGIFTPDGDIRIGTSAPNDVTIHSTLMTSDDYGVVQVDDFRNGSPRGTATIFGGVISSYYGAFGTFNSDGHVSGYSRNFVYDQRLNGGIAPPFFPTTTVFMPATSSVNPIAWTAGRQNIPGNSANFQMPSSEPAFYPDFS